MAPHAGGDADRGTARAARSVPPGVGLLAVLLAALGLVSRLAPLLAGEARLFRQLPSEDGYLMLTIARNLALGQGMSIAAGTIPTNGTQPLATLLWAVCFAGAGGDRAGGVAAVLALELAVAVATAAALFALGRRALARRPDATAAALLASAFWFAGIPALRLTMNAQETGLYALGVVLAAGALLRLDEASPARRYGAAGAGLGLVFWARNDAVFLVAAACALHLGRGFRLLRNGSGRPLVQAALLGGVALAVALPWLVHNQLRFGSIVPISGASQTLGYAFGHNLPFVPAALAQLQLNVVGVTAWAEQRSEVQALGAVALALLALLYARLWRGGAPQERRLWALTGLFGAGLVAYYGLFFGAPYFLERYLFPLSPFLALGAGLAATALRRRLCRRRGGGALALLVGVALVGLHVELHLRAWHAGARHDHWAKVAWVEENLPEEAWVGAIQSGTLGFFHDRTLNLDGKVSPEALAARRAGRLGAYVVRSPADWLVDWPLIERLLERPPVARHFELVLRDRPRRLSVLRRRSAPASKGGGR